jgi:hypothetical protein
MAWKRFFIKVFNCWLYLNIRPEKKQELAKLALWRVFGKIKNRSKNKQEKKDK